VQENTGPTPAEAYRVLGLDADADSEAVRRTYRERVKAVHPDREGGDEAEFKRVTEAYEVLREQS
jgi:curved DNA-binding protein CbpA